MQVTEKIRQDLWQAASEARSRAYAPYSGIRVGASLLSATGEIYAGANVENASYGLSLCAERAALTQAVAAEGPDLRVQAVCVISDHPGPFPPCGACRQVIYEFGPEARAIFQGEEGVLEIPLQEILPHAFRMSR